jgi:hypothetical protein
MYSASISLHFRLIYTTFSCKVILQHTSDIRIKQMRNAPIYRSDIQSFSFAYPQIYFLFNFVPLKLLVHNSSYIFLKPISKIKLNKLHSK